MKKIIRALFLFIFLNFAVQATTLDEKAGQMIIIGFDGNSVNSKGFKRALKQVESGEISGILLFSKNIKDRNSLVEMNEKFLSAGKITPFIALDNEGGKIQRHDFAYHKSAKEVSFLSEKEAKNEYKNMAWLEKELKINLNFAPCVDLAINKDSIIVKKERSYSSDPQKVAKYAQIFIDEHNKNKIITSIKHFPGHGSAKGDTHKGFVDSTEVFCDKELIPYEMLKNNDKLNTVMVSHIYNKKFDEKFPASLSEKTIKGYLIDKLDYKGVVVSDDYDMDAIRKNYTLDETVINSINAGVNLLVFSNNLKHKDKNTALKVHKIIKREIKKETIKEEDINNSYEKIVKLKSNL